MFYCNCKTQFRVKFISFLLENENIVKTIIIDLFYSSLLNYLWTKILYFTITHPQIDIDNLYLILRSIENLFCYDKKR
jgi:hypothetical protein